MRFKGGNERRWVELEQRVKVEFEEAGRLSRAASKEREGVKWVRRSTHGKP